MEGLRNDLLLEKEIKELKELSLKDNLNNEKVFQFLDQLPEETDLEYQVNIGNLIGAVPEVVPILRKILDQDGSQIQNHDIKSSEEEILFASFNILATHYRRTENVADLCEIHDRFRSRFVDRVAYQNLQAVLYRIEAKRSKDKTTVRKALELQQSVLEEVSNNPAYYQAKANTIAQAIEGNIFKGEEREELLQSGIDAANQAIDLWEEYGKYHITKGRLHALMGEYSAARDEIRKGIDLEDEDQQNYALRIGQFRRHLLQVDLKETRDQIEKDIEEFQDKLSDSKNEIKTIQDDFDQQIEQAKSEIEFDLKDELNEITGKFRNTTLQFLGFFTAIIAAVITTIQIASQYPPLEAGALMIVVFGGLTTSFGAFSLIIPDDRSIWYGIGVTAFGFTILGFAVIFLISLQL